MLRECRENLINGR